MGFRWFLIARCAAGTPAQGPVETPVFQSRVKPRSVHAPVVWATSFLSRAGKTDSAFVTHDVSEALAAPRMSISELAIGVFPLAFAAGDSFIVVTRQVPSIASW